MTLDDLRAEAERKASDLVERIREKVTVIVVRSPLTVYGMRSAKSEIERMLPGEFAAARYTLTDLLRDAWTAGVTDTQSPHTALSPDYDVAEHEMTGALNELLASMQKKIGGVLMRAAIGDASKDDVLNAIGSDRETGLFKSFTARALGTVTHEVKEVYERARAARAKELGDALALARRYRTGGSPTIGATATTGSVKNPVQIKVWLHSMGGNPPRAWHLDMHGKAVMWDQKFTLHAPKGKIHYADHPHDPKLPPEETINCHCISPPRVLWLTADEERDLRSEMAATGGSSGDRWEAFAQQAAAVTLRDAVPNPSETARDLRTEARTVAAQEHQRRPYRSRR